MGFWGVELLARGTVDVAATDVFDSWHAEVLDQREGLDGWHYLQLDGTEVLEAEHALALAVEIDGPVLLAYVLDSDCSIVTCATPDETTFQFYVHPDTAVNGYDLPAQPDDQTAAPDRLVRWTGTGADPAAVRAALASEETFAEDSLFDIAVALGILRPAAQVQDGYREFSSE